jgi:hypothetical protein
VIARAATVAVAVVVLAFCALQLRATRLQDDAQTLSQRIKDPAALAQAAKDLSAAARLNPDAAPDVARSAVLGAQQRRPQSVALLRAVVAREPDNLDAWRLLRFYARGSDPALEARALAAQRRLDPIGTRSR